MNPFNHNERSSSLLAFPLATMCTRPYNPYTKPPTSLLKLLQQIDQPSKLQHDGVPTMWMDPLWHLLLFAMRPHSLTTGAYLSSLT